MSASGDWGPAPPGVDLTENQNADIIGSVIVIVAMGLSAVVLRIFTRLSRTGPGLAEDDYVILFAAGGGKHLWVVSFDDFTKLYQTTYAFVMVYITCITATKTSILLFYRRMFGTGIIWWIVLVLTICHGREVNITWVSGCRPVDYYWKQYTDPNAEGTCIDASLFYFINGIIGLFIDVAILLVPVPTNAAHQKDVCRRHPTPRKLLVKTPDFTWAMSKVFIWSCCEPFVGIMCACLPTYAPLVRRWWTAAQSRPANSYASSSGGGDTTLRGDDEVELTYDGSGKGLQDETVVAGLKGSLGSDGSVGYRSEIMVRKDFYWSSSV
ncbi:hypothetical protein BT67DRAFT_463869 [Trichocladium antarcticum]|uniref:Rhodopsin domain-containing protein n=1 Tax=Trichocladium antarcticum TaxID=1450529 RepID=A0AAN6UFS9_9PEZI|nr:hypothetical protein BT67DRAFT_463869 [Trichocladium antarcticum]